MTENSKVKSNSKKKSINLINWNSGGNLSTTVGNTNYLRYGSIANNENQAKIIIPTKGTISDLVVELVSFMEDSDPSPGLGVSRKFTVRKNGQDTALSVTFTGTDYYKSKDNIEIEVDKYDTISLSQEVTNGVARNAIGLAAVIFS